MAIAMGSYYTAMEALTREDAWKKNSGEISDVQGGSSGLGPPAHGRFKTCR
jgi:hypothetical protein